MDWWWVNVWKNLVGSIIKYTETHHHILRFYLQNRDHDLVSLLHLTCALLTPEPAPPLAPACYDGQWSLYFCFCPTPHHSSLWSATISHTGFTALALQQSLTFDKFSPRQDCCLENCRGWGVSSVKHTSCSHWRDTSHGSKVGLPSFLVTAPLPLHYLQFWEFNGYFSFTVWFSTRTAGTTPAYPPLYPQCPAQHSEYT